MRSSPSGLAKSVAHAGSALARHWPAPCAVCGSWVAGGLCAACQARFIPPRLRCRCCGLGLAAPAEVCGRCLRQPPPMARTGVALDYAFPWDRLITAFKFGQRPELASVLAPLLVAALHATNAPRPDAVLPVPLAPARLRERGYNQAWELARRVARALDCPAWPTGLQRWRDTAAQTRLDAAERQANLRDAFLPNPALPQRLAGRHVALVDDVMTTGATVSAAAELLCRCGVAEVSVWVLARTPQPAEDRPGDGGPADGATIAPCSASCSSTPKSRPTPAT